MYEFQQSSYGCWTTASWTGLRIPLPRGVQVLGDLRHNQVPIAQVPPDAGVPLCRPPAAQQRGRRQRQGERAAVRCQDNVGRAGLRQQRGEDGARAVADGLRGGLPARVWRAHQARAAAPAAEQRRRRRPSRRVPAAGAPGYVRLRRRRPRRGAGGRCRAAVVGAQGAGAPTGSCCAASPSSRGSPSTAGSPTVLQCPSALSRALTTSASSRADIRTRGFKLSKLLANARSLSQFSLRFENGRKIWIELVDPRPLQGAFSKLTVLNLGGISGGQCELSWTIFFLQAAPFLQNFNLSIQKHMCSPHVMQQEMPYCETTCSEFKHKHLESLKIAGFEVDEKYMKFVRMVMELAMALQTIILTDQEICKYCYHVEDRPTSTGSRYAKDGREKSSIVKQLKDGMTLKAQIFIE